MTPHLPVGDSWLLTHAASAYILKKREMQYITPNFIWFTHYSHIALKRISCNVFRHTHKYLYPSKFIQTNAIFWTCVYEIVWSCVINWMSWCHLPLDDDGHAQRRPDAASPLHSGDLNGCIPVRDYHFLSLLRQGNLSQCFCLDSSLGPTLVHWDLPGCYILFYDGDNSWPAISCLLCLFAVFHFDLFDQYYCLCFSLCIHPPICIIDPWSAVSSQLTRPYLLKVNHG